MLLEEGQIIRGTYEIERFLGEGAFAEVYRAKHRFLGRQALKIFKTTGMTIEETIKLLDEAIILSSIGHPNIIRVFDANIIETSKGMCGFFTMEYVAGGTLDKFWHSYKNIFVPLETTINIIRQVCQGISVAHSNEPPIIHRDIKPANILIGYDTRGICVRISDFGLAKRVNPLTLYASARGTRCFKPPEVFQNFQCDSCSGDVWAIGTTFYLLLTDHFPYSDIGDMDSFDYKRFEKPLVPPSHFNIQVNEGLDKILSHALALKPEERYHNAHEMLSDLMQWSPEVHRRTDKAKKSDLPKSSKDALGFQTPVDIEKAKKKAELAIELACQISKLQEAADLMEEAINMYPLFREKYEEQVKLWRQGIVTVRPKKKE